MRLECWCRDDSKTGLREKDTIAFLIINSKNGIANITRIVKRAMKITIIVVIKSKNKNNNNDNKAVSISNPIIRGLCGAHPEPYPKP